MSTDSNRRDHELGLEADLPGGNAVANQVDAEAEAAHWRENYRTRPYVDPDASFDDYGPAYDYGVAGYVKYPDRTFEDAEADLSRDWDVSRMSSRLEWSHAREASLDAWMRAHGRISQRA